MYSLSSPSRKKAYKHWLNFRRYSRQVISQPMDMDLHTSRIMTAMELEEKEPLQGALADMFYGCWYDVPYFGERMLEQVKEKLTPIAVDNFQRCINGEDYVFEISQAATRWSVLISPSMQDYEHKLRVSSDDSRMVAAMTIAELLELRDEAEGDDTVQDDIRQVEDEFFAHCLTCDDRLAFSMVWWELAKNKWEFHAGWTQCRKAFEVAIYQQPSQTIEAEQAPTV